MDDELEAQEARHSGTGTVELDGVVAVVRELTTRLHRGLPGWDPAELVSLASSIEDLSRLVDHLQVVTAAAMDRGRIAAEVSDSWTTPEGDIQQEYKNTADYLRHRLRISRREAWRRIRLGSSLSPATSLTGQQIEPELGVLADSAAHGLLSGQAAQTVSMAMKRVQGCGTAEERAAMESALTEVAVSQDLDALNVVASAWINHVDPDGTAPSEQQKAELQGLFVRRKYRGLHRLDIFATEDQFETLMTALTPEASPRTGQCAGSVATATGDAAAAAGGTCVDLEGKERAVPPDPRSHAQKCLDGLVASCRIALASGQLPAHGGSKPQILAIIPYEQLSERVARTAGASSGRSQGSAMLTFAGPTPASQIRRLACEADILPVVLSGDGRILDVGTTARYFPPHLRKALIARDGGCAFPGCTAPAPWCEAHHIEYYSRGGTTGTDNGVMLCGFHHHLIHGEKWRITIRKGVPWFVPPTYVDPFQAPLRNTFFHPFRRPLLSG
ncbi:DUF222 domain-containing protein [Arthrobacter sp. zg-ZUI100]|uniref:HNH endonuclease signature motif containing protein n=1 Tax=Arthrobacter jiangjiafuii TaxID=2817475 RepID=UPI001AEEC6A5|nr:HNH endonuclease signature motif containing protein [Arthrobacter jiangjiafuii]MBP3036720.1 DUF222 domain-containing protein [Arthrobacter jiangjiafuii]